MSGTRLGVSDLSLFSVAVLPAGCWMITHSYESVCFKLQGGSLSASVTVAVSCVVSPMFNGFLLASRGLAIAGGLAAQVETWTVTSDGGLMSTLLETISCST